MPKIAVIGPGAIGGLIAAWLCQDDRNEVSVCVRTPIRHIHADTPYGSFEAHPKILAEPGQGEPVDWVLVATKSYDSDKATAWFEGLCHDRTQVAILQNGVEHVERFSQYLPEERILPIVVQCPSERTEPEKVCQRRPASLIAPNTEAGEAFAELFSRTKIDILVENDFLTLAWRKLCLNAAGAVMALTLIPAKVAHNEDAAKIMQGIIKEGAAVARAEGANLDDSVVDFVISTYQKAPGDSVNSLHADRVTGRPTEIDLRNGVIVRLGKKHGIATPYNEMVVALLNAIEARG